MPKPNSEAAITRISREGEWFRFDGVVDGKRLGVKMLVPDFESLGEAESTRYALDMLKDMAHER